MEFRLWIGLWTAIILILFSVFNLSFLVKFITRFTEDCFATLVALMFIIDAVKSTLKIYLKYPAKINYYIIFNNESECICNITKNGNSTSDSKVFLQPNGTNVTKEGCFINEKFVDCKNLSKTNEFIPDVFFFSLLLFFLTFTICLLFKNFRNKNYFPSKVIILFKLYISLITFLQ
jgi:hypothetical protein